MRDVVEKELTPGITARITLDLTDENAPIRMKQMTYILGMFEQMIEDLGRFDQQQSLVTVVNPKHP